MAPPFHPIVDLFPNMTDEEFGKLVDDIRKHGLREPVWMDREGRVIDGKHRVMACALVGVEPTTRVFSGAPADVAAFAVSVNLTRRHLTQSQRAMVASRLAEMGHESEAQNCALTQTKAAEELAVSRRSVQAAEVVRKQGVPELVEAVERGEASVSAAAQVARLPKRAQRAAVAGGTAGVKKAARKAKTPATQKPTWPEGEFTIKPDKPYTRETATLAAMQRLWREASPGTKREFFDWLSSPSTEAAVPWPEEQ